MPYTRGRERSRDVQKHTTEARGDLESHGYKEVTLAWARRQLVLLDREDGTAAISRQLLRTWPAATMRIRFSTSHPKDMSDDTLRVIAEA